MNYVQYMKTSTLELGLIAVDTKWGKEKWKLFGKFN